MPTGVQQKSYRVVTRAVLDNLDSAHPVFAGNISTCPGIDEATLLNRHDAQDGTQHHPAAPYALLAVLRREQPDRAHAQFHVAALLHQAVQYEHGARVHVKLGPAAAAVAVAVTAVVVVLRHGNLGEGENLDKGLAVGVPQHGVHGPAHEVDGELGGKVQPAQLEERHGAALGGRDEVGRHSALEGVKGQGPRGEVGARYLDRALVVLVKVQTHAVEDGLGVGGGVEAVATRAGAVAALDNIGGNGIDARIKIVYKLGIVRDGACIRVKLFV